MKKNNVITKLLFVLGILLINTVSADDTEIFFSESTQDVRHNLMFIIDGSGSMNEKVGGGNDTRLEVMKKTLSSVLTTAPDNLNVGLMNYGELGNRSKGHGVKFPISPITDKAYPIVADSIPVSKWNNKQWWYSSIPEPSDTITVRDYLSKITDWYWRDDWYDEAYGGEKATDMERTGLTPIVDALYETALYFRGEKVSNGLGDAGRWNRWSAHPSTYEGELISWDSSICDNPYTYTKTGKINFNKNSIPWLRCQGDDLSKPPSYESCRETESCINKTKTVCSNYISGYCKKYNVTESGKVCAANSWVSGYCKNNKYHTKTIKKCSYEVCNGGHTSEPDYISPINQTCQSNYIVLLSDGEPEGNSTYSSLKSKSLPLLTDKSDSSNKFSHVNCNSNKKPSGFSDGICGPELTRFLADSDNSDLDGEQGIQVYSIGFGLGGDPKAEEYLKSLVTAPDDPTTPETEGYFSTSNAEQLTTAFSSILKEISSTTTSFASPGYSVNVSTGLSNEKVVYIPVFDKQLTPRWNGNLKKFKLETNGNGVNAIKGKNNKIAVSELGVFEEDALDLWSNSNSPDGRDVDKGGAASLIDPANRLAVSDLSCSSYPCELTSEKNSLEKDNAKNNGVITNSLLGLSNGSSKKLREKLVNFARGRVWNANTKKYDSEPRMGDMLHAEPVVITYDQSYSKTDSETDKAGQVVFAATNEGYLHAFNSVSGEELFAFMPSELLKNINTQYKNTDIGNHAYGIDGYITTWFYDHNGNGVIDVGANKKIKGENDDHVYLYFGLRRGGRAYYALDVTDPKQPMLMWKASAESGQSNKFSRLGQSWSMPYLARIRESDTETKEVLVFTGGYDIKQDNEDPAVRGLGDTMGNDVFIVDALTGDYIWSIQGGVTGSSPNVGIDVTNLTHSIPGGARLLDMNRDGAIDRMYFADTKGQVWRLELPSGPSFDLSEAKLILFAELGDVSSAKDARMFFNEPDVALLRYGSHSWLTVSIGSGYRAHPANDAIADNFYVLLDKAVTHPLEKAINGEDDFTALKADDLVEITYSEGAIDKGTMEEKTIFEMDGKAGWYLVLPDTGEKVLSNSITSSGSVMFTTLVPGEGAAAAVSDPCTAPVTHGRFYSLNVLTGSAGSDLTKDGKIEDTDLYSIVTSNEIPGTPQRVFNDPVCTDEKCTHIVEIRVGKKNSPVTSYDAAFLESVFWTNPSN